MSKQIVALTSQCSEELINYLISKDIKIINYITSKNEEIDSVDFKYLDIYEEDLMSQISTMNEELRRQAENVIAKESCPCCGRKNDRGLVKDYRGSFCVSSAVSCIDCRYLSDKTYFKLLSVENKNELLAKEIFKNYKL